MQIVNEANAHQVKIAGGEFKTFFSPKITDVKNVQIGTLELPPGSRLPEGDELSSHEAEEFSYIIKGKLRVWSEGEEQVLEEGDCIFNAPGNKHWCRAEGDLPVKLVWVLSPPDNNIYNSASIGKELLVKNKPDKDK